MTKISDQKCGLVALVGAPNAGKSTLTNALVGEKVSIVTHKVQTTRQRVTGIAMQGNAQLVLLDTPGLFQPKERMERAMVEAAYDAAHDADIRIFILDALRAPKLDEVQALLEKLSAPLVVVLNKVDKVPHNDKESLLHLAKIFDHPKVDRVFMISALHEQGVADLKDYLTHAVPTSPWLYPEEDLCTLSERLLAAEITREQLIVNLHQELPYDTYVETEKFENFRNGDVKISQVIVVAKKGQKAIVLGQKGAQIKAIRESAQYHLSKALGCKVHVFLHVKVIEKWQEKGDFYNMTGLNFKA